MATYPMETLKLSPLLIVVALYLLPAEPTQALAEAEEQWQLIWSDEFEGDGLPNHQWWDYETGKLRNNELQYYTEARLANCRQEDGVLIIEARNDGFEGNAITSASLTSLRSASWTYGKFEVSAQLAAGRGTWPAIWMLGDNVGEVGWPHCGEIDIMEFVGYDSDTVHGTVHTTSFNHILNTARGGTIDFDDLTESMHIYSVEWEPEEIRFYVDGHLYFSFPNDGLGNDSTWPFHRPQHLKLNLAVGGDWGGAQGVDTSIYPTEFLIDYVRVYQRPQVEPFTVSLKATGPGELRLDPEKETYAKGETVTLIADPDVGMRLGKWKNVQVSRALKTEVVVDRPLFVEADFVDPRSIIQNTGFESGLDTWYNYIDSSSDATIVINQEKQAAISVTDSGTADWHVQFGQGGFPLLNGNRYELTFDAKITSGTPKLVAAIAQNLSPYATFQSSTIDLTSDEKRYTLSFTHSQSSSLDARVEFRLGTQLGAIALDNVRLLNLDQSPLTPFEEWKRINDIRPLDDAADPDQDLRPNLLEFIRGTYPFEKDPYQPVALVSVKEGHGTLAPNFELDPDQADILITLQESSDLEKWRDTNKATSRFQRLKNYRSCRHTRLATKEFRFL
ncbi:family 16 glycosylhydrolase [Pelagicoccus sp. SDUM812002]|uniref:family 16 glycosylhydrolase n=1 Tax=Pelagicoccus sp. SDUM812002 TaxID=3041266 RepID=UPI00280CAD8D|nr:family 16 glycosylhydrolase [Pelagicoccus sp. SDUM812002]MDQ8187293.1 family 16 glycosylhydrolase [Pelagicoccus sp. SDUM812002]